MKISRRDFLRMAAYSTAAVGAAQFDMFKLNEALAAGKPPVIWFEGLGDSGCIVSLANYFDGASSGIESVLLNSIDLKFNSVLMGASGEMAISAAKAVYDNYATTPYILVLSGSLSNLNGYAVVGEDNSTGGLGVMNVVEAFNRWQSRAKAVILVGSCACYGGMHSIGGNQFNNVPEAFVQFHNGSTLYPATRSTSYPPNKSVYIPGCPAHPDWVVLTMVHIIQRWSQTNFANYMPPRDTYKRPISVTIGAQTIPLFQDTVHSQCPRKPEHDLGHFAESVGDPVKCLRAVGCRGTETYADCPTRGWNSTGTNGTGKFCTAPGINHICIGCSQPMFPAVPFNRQITNITFP
ncbi:MAG: twin-arginine translocation signal domain-containing protein [Pseudomonadota bacterium]